MTEELVIRQIRMDEVAGRGDSDSRMMSFEVIMPLKVQSTKILIYSIWDVTSVHIYSIWDIISVYMHMHNTNCPIVRSFAFYRLVICENEWRVDTKEKWRVGV